MLQRFSSRSPSCVLYDEKLTFYSSIGQEIAVQPMNREVKFALLHMEPLARALQVISTSAHRPLPTIGNSLEKQKSLYRVLKPSIKPPI